MSRRPILALTIGDPVGIGPEITAKTLADVIDQDGHHGIAVGDVKAFARGAKAAGVTLPVRAVDRWDLAPETGTIDVFDIGVLGDDLPAWGVADERAGRAAVVAIEVATKAALNGEVDAVVTAPINKEAIWASGSQHLGHTEMLGELTGARWFDTMFVMRRTRVEGLHLRVFFATRHMSLSRAISMITRDNLLQSIHRAHQTLRVFDVAEPRIAVAALNPHGGENGNFGTEEIEHISPAIEAARAEGLDVVGPIPADSIFHQGIDGRYDGIISLFHDQGHIPTKTYDFDGTISVTVGLPILRTSVDHGTAFDIAGKGIATHATMLSAYLAAVDYAPYLPSIRSTFGRYTA
jgi:4-hydroxythreonine-4-phosphate dehydrogenase